MVTNENDSYEILTLDRPSIAVRDQAKGRALCVLATVDFARSESTSFSWEGHWAGGVHTKLAVRKNQAGRTANATDKDVVELVRELAKAWPDSYIAGVLNRSGYQTGPGNAWNETRVKNLRI